MATSTPADRRSEIRALRDKAKILGIPGYDDLGRLDLKAAVEKAEAQAKAPKAKAASPAKAATEAPTSKATKAKSKAKPASKPATSKPAKAEKPAKATKATSKSKTKAAPAPAPKAEKPAKTKAAKAKPAKAAKAEKPEVEEDPTGNPFRKGTDRHFIFGLLVKGGTRRAIAEKVEKKITLRPYSEDAGEPKIMDYDKRVQLTAQVLRDQFGFNLVKDGRGLAGTIQIVPGKASKAAPKAASKTSSKKKVAKAR